MADEEQKPTKVCFVTIGATAPFNLLLSNVLNTRFLDSLSLYGYTDLLIQFGNEGRVIFEEYMHKYPFGECGLNISGFDFNKTGLSQEMLSTKGNKDAGRRRAEGMILSHAGNACFYVVPLWFWTLTFHHRTRLGLNPRSSQDWNSSCRSA
jgi:beta-1,4-N-acetylglucosaminyltransferase